MPLGCGLEPPRHFGRIRKAPPKVQHPPFDLYLCDEKFPRIYPLNDDASQAAILKRCAELTPPEIEIANMTQLVQEVQKIINAIMLRPQTVTGCFIEHSHQVGSMVKGTILRGHKTADLVLVLRAPPVTKNAAAIADRILQGIKSSKISNAATYGTQVNDTDFEIKGLYGTVCVKLTTAAFNLHKLNPSTQSNEKIFLQRFESIDHALWFGDNLKSNVIINVARLLKDMKKRFEGLRFLDPWSTELLAHYCVMNNDLYEPLTETNALRRALQLISAGLFLPGCLGIPNPCERVDTNRPIRCQMDSKQQDEFCLTAQNLLRILAHGGVGPLLNGPSSITSSATLWKGIIVTPVTKVSPSIVNDKPTERMDTSETT